MPYVEFIDRSGVGHKVEFDDLVASRSGQGATVSDVAVLGREEVRQLQSDSKVEFLA